MASALAAAAFVSPAAVQILREYNADTGAVLWVSANYQASTSNASWTSGRLLHTAPLAQFSTHLRQLQALINVGVDASISSSSPAAALAIGARIEGNATGFANNVIAGLQATSPGAYSGVTATVTAVAFSSGVSGSAPASQTAPTSDNNVIIIGAVTGLAVAALIGILIWRVALPQIQASAAARKHIGASIMPARASIFVKLAGSDLEADALEVELLLNDETDTVALLSRRIAVALGLGHDAVLELVLAPPDRDERATSATLTDAVVLNPRVRTNAAGILPGCSLLVHVVAPLLPIEVLPKLASSSVVEPERAPLANKEKDAVLQLLEEAQEALKVPARRNSPPASVRRSADDAPLDTEASEPPLQLPRHPQRIESPASAIRRKRQEAVDRDFSEALEAVIRSPRKVAESAAFANLYSPERSTVPFESIGASWGAEDDEDLERGADKPRSLPAAADVAEAVSSFLAFARASAAQSVKTSRLDLEDDGEEEGAMSPSMAAAAAAAAAAGAWASPPSEGRGAYLHAPDVPARLALLSDVPGASAYVADVSPSSRVRSSPRTSAPASLRPSRRPSKTLTVVHDEDLHLHMRPSRGRSVRPTPNVAASGLRSAATSQSPEPVSARRVVPSPRPGNYRRRPPAWVTHDPAPQSVQAHPQALVRTLPAQSGPGSLEVLKIADDSHRGAPDTRHVQSSKPDGALSHLVPSASFAGGRNSSGGGGRGSPVRASPSPSSFEHAAWEPAHASPAYSPSRAFAGAHKAVPRFATSTASPDGTPARRAAAPPEGRRRLLPGLTAHAVAPLRLPGMAVSEGDEDELDHTFIFRGRG